MAAFLRRVGEIFMLVHSNTGRERKNNIKNALCPFARTFKGIQQEWQKLNAKTYCTKLHWAGHKGQI